MPSADAPPAIVAPATASAEPAHLAYEPEPRATFPWFATQLIPSPELAYGTEGALFGMRWQLSPILYSFGMNRRLSPWRSFVVEPLTRQSGSIELVASPSFLPAADASFALFVGPRATFPVLHRGEYLSVSVGSSLVRYGGETGVAYEAGVHVLFGVLGLVVTACPSFGPLSTITTIRIRYF